MDPQILVSVGTVVAAAIFSAGGAAWRLNGTRESVRRIESKVDTLASTVERNHSENLETRTNIATRLSTVEGEVQRLRDS